jgi:hypothetical protein
LFLKSDVAVDMKKCETLVILCFCVMWSISCGGCAKYGFIFLSLGGWNELIRHVKFGMEGYITDRAMYCNVTSLVHIKVSGAQCRRGYSEGKRKKR